MQRGEAGDSRERSSLVHVADRQRVADESRHLLPPMIRTRPVAFVVFSLPALLTGCPALLSDWSVDGGERDAPADTSMPDGRNSSSSSGLDDGSSRGSSSGSGGTSDSSSGSSDASSWPEAAINSDADGGTSSGSDADAGPPCLTDLSNIGTGDFHVAFTLQTTAGSIDMALINQRTGCDETSAWWDVSYIPSTSTQGALAVGTCDGSMSSYVILEQAAAVHPDDGMPHRIVVSRTGGQLRFTLDGALAAGPVADTYAFGVLPPLKVGVDDCPGFGATAGTIADLCITTP